MRNRFPLALPALVLAVGCSGGTTAPETNLEDVFCELLGGTTDAVTAVALDSTDDGPELLAEDVALDIALVDDGTGMFGGRATYTPDEVGSFAFGLSDDVPFVLLDGDTEVPFDAEVAGGCDAMAVRYTVALEIQTYTVEIGPTDIDVLGLVSEESDDDL
jgi:hypothetical protein